MVQILPRRQSLGEDLASGLGSGLSQGFASAIQQGLASREQQKLAQAKEMAKLQRQQQIYEMLIGPQQKNIREKEEMAPEEGSFSSKIMKEPQEDQFSDEQIMAASVFDPNLARTMMESKKLSRKEKSEQKSLGFGETKEYRESLTKQARSSEELEPVLKQMERLIDTGKLTNPIVAKLADKFGLVGLLDPKSQQFQALSIGFLKDAKNIFGSRVTNYDLQTYLDKIPRLAQTDAGKKSLIDNFRTLGKASTIRKKEANKIIKENGGVPPLDLEEQVNERSAPQIDKLADEFNKNFIKSSRSPSGKIFMRSPDGTLGEVPEDKVSEAMELGFMME